MNAVGKVVLDTSVVVDYLRQDTSLHQKVDGVEDVYLPLTALGELLYGAYKSKSSEKMLDQVRKFARGCILMLPDETTADFYARIKSDLAGSGQVIPENDIWIAALAKTHNLPLVTRDRHFSFVSGLTILNW